MRTTDRGFAAVIDGIYAGLEDGAELQSAMERLTILLDVEVALTLEVSLLGAAVPTMVIADRGGDARRGPLSDYQVGRYLHDPAMAAVARARCGPGSFDPHRDMDADMLRSDPFSRWCRGEAGLEARTILFDRETPDTVVAMSANRASGRSPLEEEGRRLLADAFDHLRRARRLRRLASRAWQDEASLLFDITGRIVSITPPAETLLVSARGLALRYGRLMAEEPGDQPTLDRLIAAAVPPLALGGRDGAVAIHRAADHRALLVRAYPRPAAANHGILARDYLGGALVHLLDPGDAAPVRSASWRTLFRFTAAETRLAAALLADEANLRQVADRLGIAYNTARTQAASLYDKAGVRGQVGLVRLLTRLER